MATSGPKTTAKKAKPTAAIDTEQLQKRWQEFIDTLAASKPPTDVNALVQQVLREGMSRALLKLSGSLVHDYATISDDSPSPNRASRARRAATSASIS